MQRSLQTRTDRGFSLLELLIAMAITVVLLGLGSSLLMGSFNIRHREDQVSDALADAQRAINIMSREIANAGFNLSTNGIVPGDSDSSSIRIRSNLNRYDSTADENSQNDVIDPGEDIKYFINAAENTNYLVRYDANNLGDAQKTVLANRLDSLRVHYFAQQVTYATAGCDITDPSAAEVAPEAARYIVIAVCVQLQEYGTPNSPGHQPFSTVLLASDVTLRNADLRSY
jgi:prepilin-type N-terminal cleavage/methylation domain-containing protein